MTRQLTSLLLAIATVACSQPPARPRPVGLAFRAYADAARRDWSGTQARPLATAVWYPAAPGARETEWRVGPFSAGWSARDAPLAADTPALPLVVLSHGTGGGAATLSWLAEALAARGYLVAAVNHHGNTAAEPAYRLEGFMVWWERARDLSAVLDALLADPTFGARIDRSRIGVAGFSLGGYTALAVVGARLDHERWRAFCAAQPADANCRLPPEAPFPPDAVRDLLDHDARMQEAVGHAGDPYRDARIRAAFVAAPVLGPALTPESLAAITTPVRVVVGTDDEQAVPAVNARPIAAAIPGAELELIPGATHYVFLAPCTTFGRLLAGALCRDPAVDRRAVHDHVADAAVAFFDRTLRAR